MGVPGLEPFVCAKSRGSVTEIIQGENLKREVDYFYADSNGALHSICQRIFNYGEKKMLIDMYEGVSYEKKILDVYREYFMSLVNVTKVVRPRKVLYIAIDGAAPLAKQNQQRQRRFGRISSSEFDSSNITPGTRFMHDLTIFIKESIPYAIDGDMCPTNSFQKLISGTWEGIEVIFSPPTVAGEGEHKLMEYTRSLPETEKIDASHCFFGPDGDLIMLGLTSALPKVHLLRQDIFRNGGYKYIDIGCGFSSTVSKLFGLKTHTSLQHTKDDFVVSGLFVGNDFLPKIQMFATVRDGLDFMMHTLQSTRTPLSSNSKVDIGGLKKFISLIAKSEKDMLLDQVLTDDRRRLPPEGDIRYLNMLILENIQVNDTINFDYVTYRKAYNRKHFSKSGDSDVVVHTNVKKACHDYLKTLVWVFEYYRNGIVDWDWAYRHHYPPLMIDFASYLNTVPNDIDFRFELGNPTFPFEQLLGVLPRSSSSLLPDEFAIAFDELKVDVGVIEYDYQGKIREHEAVILLPFSDYRLVRRVYHSVKEKASRTYSRDTPGHPFHFVIQK